jgi:hypothetical protein
MKKQIHKTKPEIVQDKTIEKAKATIAAQNKKDAEACAKEAIEALNVVCKKYNCAPVVTGQFYGNRIESKLSFVKKT